MKPLVLIAKAAAQKQANPPRTPLSLPPTRSLASSSLRCLEVAGNLGAWGNKASLGVSSSGFFELFFGTFCLITEGIPDSLECRGIP